MKSPREILLNRHKPEEPKLEAISRRVLGGVRQEEMRRGLGEVIYEWLWPSPIAWGAVAAIWLVLAALSFEGGGRDVPVVASNGLDEERWAALRNQRRLYVELVADEKAPAPVAGPRSERFSMSANT